LLVADWAAGQDQPVAWLSLDHHDDEPVRFWTALVAAVHRARPAETAALADLVIASPFGQDALRRILRSVEELPGPLILVLDDFNEVHHPAVLDGVAELLRHPSPLRVVLVSRTDPPLHLQRLRVDGFLTEIRTADLAFTETESLQLLDRAGARTTDGQNRQLVQRTEGWAAGLRLAALSVARTGDDDRIEDFLSTDRSVADYFGDEVLSTLTPERRRFLLHTSVTDRLSGELADLLSGGTTGQAVLEGLEAANAFVVRLGPGSGWFRYHRLMADLLRHRLSVEEPEIVRVLHRRAARWFAGRNEPLEAVRHAVRAGDWDLVGRLITTVAGALAVSTERETFATLLSGLPAAQLTESAEVRVCAVVERFLARDYAGMAHHARQARLMLTDRDPADARPVLIFLGVSDMILSRAGGDMAGVAAAARKLLDEIALPDSRGLPAAQFEAPALNNLGVAHIWSGRPADGEEVLWSAHSIATQSGAELAVLNTYGYLGLVALLQGRLGSATRLAGRGRDLMERRGWAELAQSIVVHVVLAESHLLRNEIAAAQHRLELGIAAQRNDPERLPYFALQCLRARLLLSGGHIRQAEAVVMALDTAVRELADADLVRQLVVTAGAEVELAAGRPAAALRRISGYRDRHQDEPQELALLAVRAHLALRQRSESEQILRTVRAQPRTPVIAV
ncbi:MAG TPA: hypothetical protein VFU98_07650, partial [Microlunatus sp.]|nr:hypothetical protein [Microlunatus sp.]